MGRKYDNGKGFFVGELNVIGFLVFFEVGKFYIVLISFVNLLIEGDYFWVIYGIGVGWIDFLLIIEEELVYLLYCIDDIFFL